MRVGTSGGACEFESLLAPVTHESLIDEFWGRKPLFIKGGEDKLRRLFGTPFTRADFVAAIRRSRERQLKGYRLWACRASRAEPEGGEAPSFFKLIQPDQIDAMFAAGNNIGTLCLDDTRLARLAAIFKARLGHFGEVVVAGSLSPGGVGWPPHFDRVSAVFIQCEGSKRYVLSPEPVVSYPRSGANLSDDGQVTDYHDHEAEPWEEVYGIDTGSFIEVTMEPGDILIIPAGTIHATEAGGGDSLNINLLFQHTNFLTLVGRVMEEKFARDPSWRHVPVPGASGLSQFRRGELPDDLAAFFAGRLDELRRAVEGMVSDSPDLNRAWQKSLSQPGEATLDCLPHGPGGDAAPKGISRKDVLRLSRRGPVTCAAGVDEDGDPSFHLYHLSQEVSAAGEWAPLLRTLARQTRFEAEAATLWKGGGKRYPWRAVREYLQVLEHHGFIERVAE